jgi:hypothetical protein
VPISGIWLEQWNGHKNAVSPSPFQSITNNDTYLQIAATPPTGKLQIPSPLQGEKQTALRSVQATHLKSVEAQTESLTTNGPAHPPTPSTTRQVMKWESISTFSMLPS